MPVRPLYPIPRAPSPPPWPDSDPDSSGSIRERLRALEVTDAHTSDRLRAGEAWMDSIEKRIRAIEDDKVHTARQEQEKKQLAEDRVRTRKDAIALVQWGFVLLAVVGYLLRWITAEDLRTLTSVLAPGK